MDSNKNEECCYNRTAAIGVDCIAKAVSAAKYQNQFNNNNLIEQENLMPAVVHERVHGMAKDDELSPVVPQPNGAASNDMPAKEKVLAENGSTRPVTAIFTPSPLTASAQTLVDAPTERLPSRQHGTVECLTLHITSFNPTTNGTSSTVPETNGFDKLPPNASGTGRREEPGTVETETSRQATLDDGSGLPTDDGEFSDNNSLGNLSYASENGLIEEIILLPNNVYSDDDNASTSDDCIYAYRGGEPAGAAGQLLDLQGDQPPDDETDFLEMDFDPEPSSEMENFNRRQEFAFDLVEDQYADVNRPAEGQHGAEQGGSGQRSPVGVSSSPAGVAQEEAVATTSMNGLLLEKAVAPVLNAAQSVSPVTTPDNIAQVTEKDKAKKEPEEDRYQTAGPSHDRSQAHKTGAIPKSVPIQMVREGSSNSKNLKLDLGPHPDEPDGSRYAQFPKYYELKAFGPPGHLRRPNEEREEAHCLDCAEREFLMHTKQDPTRLRFCNVCNRTKKGHKDDRGDSKEADLRPCISIRPGAPQAFYPVSDHNGPRERSDEEEDELMDLRAEQIVFEALHKINTLKDTPPSGGILRVEGYGKGTASAQDITEKDRTFGLLHDQVVPIDYYEQGCSENSVTIYTINCGELTIIEALARIGIVPNMDVLRQYFNDQYEVDTAKMTIPQYLLHMSKRDCNYKKLIEAIKSCCEEQTLDVQYYPLDPFSDVPEIVQISSCEIAKRWNANTNLRQIIHFKHKHFHTLNVLGKIVNILRQPSRGRRTNHMIGIPQYYKSGSITITRIAGS